MLDVTQSPGLAFELAPVTSPLESVVAPPQLLLVANGFDVFFFDGYRPTPELSLAVRELKCSCGIMMSASPRQLLSAICVFSGPKT